MSFYTSLTGLNAATTELAVTSNNIANAGTSGFKRSDADFGDIFATSPLQRAASVIGAGVSLKSVSQEFSQGNIEFSANSLDLAITGDGFFALESPDGTKIFTRNGGFMLNEQNQMVNAAGQALMSLPVDSTNTADFSAPLTAMTIPRQTVAEFRATTSVELGLNLPSTSEPITEVFNPNNPDTYHKTTSLTVYGASGSSHLATIYYVKTGEATAADPFNKWQTHVYIDDQKVTPRLIQSADTAGDKYYVNKYGELKTELELLALQRTSAESEKYLITTGTQYKKYSYDQLSTPINSQPAAVEMKIPATSPYTDNLNLTNNQDGVDFSTFTRANLKDMFNLSIDGSPLVSIGLEHLAGDALKLSGNQIAFELENVLNSRFGDGKRFDFGAAGGDAEAALGKITLYREAPVWTGAAWSVPKNITLDLRALVAAAGATYNVDANGEVPPEELAEIITTALDANAASGNKDFEDIEVIYDYENLGFRFTQGGAKKDNIYVASTAGSGNNSLFGVKQIVVPAGGDVAEDNPPTYGTLLPPLDSNQAITLLGNVLPNGTAERALADQRYGLQVSYADGQFNITSGQTGDTSSIQVTVNSTTAGNPAVTTLSPASLLATDLLGVNQNGHEVTPQVSTIANLPTVRGQASQAAVVNGGPMGVDPSASFAVTPANKTLTCIVDGISSQITLTEGQYSIGTFTTHLQEKINLMADGLGRSVSGITVGFDDATEQLIVTGGTAKSDSFIQIAGSSDWGLDNVEAAFARVSTYIQLYPDQQGSADVYVAQDTDGNWEETTDKGEFDEQDIPYWTPIFLDRGELTFDTSGTLVSPMGGAELQSDGITGTSIAVAYDGSTQFNSPFAVLSQNQNGAAEGDLVGVNIGDNGLVVASYSNGSQKSLGKIIIANFATPKGLRQIGDASFFATSESGEAAYGEPGAAGFGTLRAGARERSNVDLTGELVDLITAQRNFQANAKAIETSSSLTQTIINIRG